jgi:sodium/potassium/calcium exchanger 6
LFKGAGVFVTSVVAGTICLARPFRSIQRPLLRDIIFFLVASYGAYVAMYDGKIHFAESLGFILMYVFYLVVLIGGHMINRKMKDRRALLQATQTEQASRTYGSIQTLRPSTAVSVDDNGEITSNNIPDESYAQPDVSYALYLRHAFLPRDDEPWAEKSKFTKAYTVIKVR